MNTYNFLKFCGYPKTAFFLGGDLMAKSNYIHIRVTEEQKYKIKQEAEKYNLSITEYVLQSINNITVYNNLLNYLKDKIQYYSSINNIELASVYLDLFFKLQNNNL